MVILQAVAASRDRASLPPLNGPGFVSSARAKGGLVRIGRARGWPGTRDRARGGLGPGCLLAAAVASRCKQAAAGLRVNIGRCGSVAEI